MGIQLCFISDCPWLLTFRPCTRGSGTRPTMWCLQVREESFHVNLRQLVTTGVKRREFLVHRSRLLKIEVFLTNNYQLKVYFRVSCKYLLHEKQEDLYKLETVLGITIKRGLVYLYSSLMVVIMTKIGMLFQSLLVGTQNVRIS